MLLMFVPTGIAHTVTDNGDDTETFTETFTDHAIGANPFTDTSGTGGRFVYNWGSNAGRVVAWDSQGNEFAATITPAFTSTADACNDDVTVSWALLVESVAATDVLNIGLRTDTASTTANTLSFTVTENGGNYDLALVFEDADSSSSISLGQISLDTWYDFTLGGINCTSGIGGTGIVEGIGQDAGFEGTTSVGTELNAFGLWTAAGNDARAILDNVTWAGNPIGAVADTDGDGVPDVQDNCPADSNAGQRDRDFDGTGDACDSAPDGLSTYTEDFEDDTSGENAADDWYTQVEVGPCAGISCKLVTRVAPATPQEGDQYALANWAQTSDSIEGGGLSTSLFDWCNSAVVITFYVRSDANLATAGHDTRVGFTGSNGATSATQDFLGINFRSNNTVYAYALSTPVSGTDNNGFLGARPATGTWIDFTFTDIDCVSNTLTVTSSELGSQATVTTGNAMADITPFFVGARKASSGNVDVEVDNITVTAPNLPWATSVDVTDLTGMDVDNTGTALIARNGTGAWVTTYTPLTLDEYQTLSAGNCNRAQGVAAIQTHVAYAWCDGAGDVEQIRIRSPSLDEPDRCSWCQKDIKDTLFDFIEVPDDLLDIADISEYAFDYRTAETRFINTAGVVFAYTEATTGKWGLYVVTMVKNDADLDDIETVQFAPNGQTIDHLCSWKTGTNGEDLVAVADSSVGARVYSFEVSLHQTAAGPKYLVDDIDIHRVLPGSYSNANAIGCSNAYVVIGDAVDERIALFDVVNASASQPLWVIEDLTIDNRGLHMVSGPGGTYIAAVTTTSLNVYDFAGVELCSLDLPDAGIFKEVKMDLGAQNAWLAFDDSIYRYDLWPCTTQQESPYSGDQFASGAVDTDGDGIPDGAGSGSGSTACEDPSFTFFGVDICTGIDADGDGNAEITGSQMAAFVGILLVVAMSASFFFLTKMHIMGAGGGGVLGLVMAGGFDLLPVWSVVLVFGMVVAVIVWLVARRA